MFKCTVFSGLAIVLLVGPGDTAHGRTKALTATVCVDIRKEKAPVPAGIYGVFMEEISHAFDGGIYAELIRNRSFEEGILPPGMKLVKNKDGGLKMELDKLPPGVPAEKSNMPWPWSLNCGWDPKRELLGWSLRNEGGAEGRMKITNANPMNAASARSLELTVASGDGAATVALVNSGYWGISVKKGTSYKLKFHLRTGGFQGKVTALLESKDGRILASLDDKGL